MYQKNLTFLSKACVVKLETNFYRLALGAIACAGLVACGGGGGGGGTAETSASNVSLSGIAYKGILKNAEVSAYQIINGVMSSTPIKTVTTGVDGSYTLDLPSTDNPVVLKVKTVASTTMLDESQINADGTFKEVPTDVGVEMRSFVNSLKEKTVGIMINPGTEQTLAMAEQTLNADGTTKAGLTPDVLTLAKTKVKESFNGDDPFAVAPPAKAADIVQSTVQATMIGLASQANSDGNCKLACQLAKFSEVTSAPKLTADGSLTVTDAEASKMRQKVSTAATQGSTTLNTAAANTTNTDVKKASTMVANVKSSLNNAAPVSTTTPSATNVAANTSFDSFITAMRDSIQATKNDLKTETDRIDSLYKSSSVGSMSIVSDLFQMVKDRCLVGNSLGCSSGNGVTWSAPDLACTLNSLFGNGRLGTCYNFSGTLNGHIVSGRISGEYDGKTAYLELSNLQISKNNKLVFVNTKTLTMDVVDGASATPKKSTAVINGTLKANDQTPGSSKYATLNLSNMNLAYTQLPSSTGVSKDGSGTLKGTITVALDTGVDTLISTVDGAFTVWNETLTIDGQSLSKATYIDQLSLSGGATGSNKTLSRVTLDMTTGGRPPKGDNVALAADNFSTTAMNGSLNLISGTAMNATYTHAVWNQMVMNLKVTTKDGDQISVDGTYMQREKLSANDYCQTFRKVSFCTDQMTATSSGGTYTTTLKLANDKVNGDIYKGSSKVGEIVDGVVYANGKKISLY
jgi:hypothetical protein